MLELFDKDSATKDDFLGTVELSVRELMELDGREATTQVLDEAGDVGKNGTVTYTAMWAPTHNDAERVKLHAMCLCSIGIYGADNIQCKSDTKAWVEVSCNNCVKGWPAESLKTSKNLEKKTVIDNDEETAKITKKISQLRKHKMPDLDIAEILEIEPARLDDYKAGKQHKAVNDRDLH